MENFDILDLTMTMNESKPASGHSCTPVGRLGEESLYSPEDQGRDICNHNHNDCNDDDDDDDDDDGDDDPDNTDGNTCFSFWRGTSMHSSRSCGAQT